MPGIQIRPSVRRRLIETNLSALYKGFVKPPQESHTLPFYLLNADVTQQELTRQIQMMHQNGIRMFILKAAAGLHVNYLSKTWMSKVKHCVAAARKLDMQVWIYDDARGPSGIAGGLVAKQGEHFRARAMEMKVMEPEMFENTPNVLKVFVATLRDRIPTRIEERSKEKIVPSMLKGRHLLVVYRRRAMPTPHLNGEAWVDLLQARTTDAFIRMTHDAYEHAIGHEFGKTVQGFFTDRPAYLSQAGSYEHDAHALIPWSHELPEFFYKRYGYRFESQIPSLFFDVGDFVKIRFDFWETLSLLFSTTYTARLQQWCGTRDLKLTGCFPHSESYHKQIACSGNSMLHAIFMDIPGMYQADLETDNIIGAKRTASVSHQLRRERTLGSLYTGADWGISFAEQKYIADWHLALSVNLLGSNHFAYSLEGYRKREASPSLFFQQPWWPCYKELENYFARACFMLSQGDFDAKLLLLGPFNAAWPAYRPGNPEHAEQVDASFRELCTHLYQGGHSFDIGDQRLLDEYGRISTGRIHLAKSKYNTIMIPSLSILKEITVDILLAFMEHGGRILAVEPLPIRIRGGSKEKLERFKKHAHFTAVPANFTAIRRVLGQISPPHLRITTPSGKPEKNIRQYRRRTIDAEILFLFNHNQARPAKVKIIAKDEDPYERWDLTTGAIHEIPQKNGKKQTEMQMSFAPGESILLVRPLMKSQKKPLASPKPAGTVICKSKWEGKPLHPNALPLDYCQYRIGNAPWSERMPVWQANEEIRQSLGLSSTLKQQVRSPWACTRNESKIQDPEISVRYTFHVAKKFSLSNIHLAYEPLPSLKVFVNQSPVALRSGTGWVDTSFHTASIREFVSSGSANTVTLVFKMSGLVDVEPVFLKGQFAVNISSGRKCTIQKEASVISTGDWTRNGYPFYAGAIRYTQKIKLPWRKNKSSKILLEMSELQGAAAMIRINNKKAGIVGWHPMVLDITSPAKTGTNQIDIDVYTGLRNLFGPHHIKSKKPVSTDGQVLPDAKDWTDSYQLISQGLTGTVKIRRVSV